MVERPLRPHRCVVGGKVLPPHARTFIPDRFSSRRVLQPCYEGQDDVADYAQTLRKPIPADPDDVFSEDDDDDTEDVAELLAARPVLPSGKWVGIGIDACAALIELQKLIGELDFFSAGDTGLGRLQQASERANVILQRAGYRNGNAA
jgi:hypothetical protein